VFGAAFMLFGPWGINGKREIGLGLYQMLLNGHVIFVVYFDYRTDFLSAGDSML
jgi:hypothetical protein